MNENKQDILNNISAVAMNEAMEIFRNLMSKYPSEEPYSSAIVLETLENVLAFALTGIEGTGQAKMITKTFLAKVKKKHYILKEQRKEFVKNKATSSEDSNVAKQVVEEAIASEFQRITETCE